MVKTHVANVGKEENYLRLGKVEICISAKLKKFI